MSQAREGGPRHLLIAGVAALSVILAAEGLARVGIDRLTTHCYTAARIGHRDFWPEYTAPKPRPDGHRLVVLMSNSQGHYRKFGGRYGYPALLESSLSAPPDGLRVDVANWSIPGGNLPEMIILAARAAAHQPDLILLVTYIRNFTDREAPRALALEGRDIYHLAYLPEVRRHLSPWFVRAYELRSRKSWLAAHSQIVHLQAAVTSALRGRTFPEDDLGASLDAARPWTPLAERLLREWVDTVRRGMPDVPIRIVGMPVNPERFTPESRAHLASFYPRADKLVGDRRGVQVLDASQLIDLERFGDSVHFDNEGHEIFARWLLPRVRRSLELAR